MPSSRYTIATTLLTILSTTPNITPAYAAHDNPTNGAAPTGEKYHKSGSGCDHEATTTTFMIDLGSNFKFDTLADCCAQSFDSDATYDTCLDNSNGAIPETNKFYPRWQGDKNYCVKDCDPEKTGADPNCGGILPTASKDTNTYADAVACCAAHYSWVSPAFCLHESTDPTVDYTGTNKYWKHQSEGICYKDCKGGTECGGIADNTWQTLYDTLDACCDTVSGSKSWCIAQTDPTIDATNEWFVKDNTCVKDCVGTGPECASANRYNKLVADSATCCSTLLSWQNQEYCKTRSDPNEHGVGGKFSGKWFVDYGDNVCVKDCNDSADKACDNSLKDSSMVLYDTAADCCSNKLGWIPNTQCADLSTTGAAAVKTGTSKWYADYASTKRCVLDCKDSTNCGGIVPNTAGVSLYDDAAACCAAKFSWYNQDLCEKKSSNDGTGYTGKWHVQFDKNACVTDCPKSTASPSCNPADLGTTKDMYDTAESCCSAKLGWVDQEACKSKSTNGADAPVVGTNKYHANFSNGSKGQCGKDCKEDSADPGCTGIVSGSEWVDTLYDTAAGCCSAKYNWVNQKLCEMKSEGTNNGHTNWFYPKISDNICVQDCAKGSSDKCDGAPTDMSIPMYESIESCCSTSIGWHPAAKCQQVPEADQATNEYWINWKVNKCVKNCPTSQGGSCGGLAEAWDQKFGSSSSCCSQPAFAWKDSSECVK